MRFADIPRRAPGAVLLTALIVAAACSQPYQWKTSDVSGRFPDLAFTLVNERGETVTEADFADTINLLFFGYTSCPDVCPSTLSRLSRALDRLKPAERRRLRVLFVSVDPRRDTPERLRQYTGAFGPRFIGLTATVPVLRKLTGRYYSTFSYGEPDENGNYSVNHNGSVLVFDRQGRARLKISASSVGGTPRDSVEAIASDLRHLIAHGDEAD